MRDEGRGLRRLPAVGAAAAASALARLSRGAPAGPFHLILCRNLAFTYFDLEVQRAVLDRILSRLAPGGALVIGSPESLPEVGEALEPWSARCGVFRKSRCRLPPASEPSAGGLAQSS